MKIGSLLFIFILILVFIGVCSADLSFIKNSQKVKVSQEVIEEFENKSEVNVFIKINDSRADEIIGDLIGEDKINNELSDAVTANLSLTDLDKIKNLDSVESVKLEDVKHIMLQDSVPLINASLTWNLQVSSLNLTGRGQTVCVIDTGVNYSHSSLGGCFGNNDASSSCKVIGGYDFYNDDANPIDDNGHGTHVAGIIAANGSIRGVAPEAKIIAIKACDSSGTACTDGAIASGIEFCINNASRFNISVISMSLGSGGYSDYCNDDNLAPYIDLAVGRNISVVVATGNDGWYDALSSPACVENATPISATSKLDVITGYANTNALVMLLAPGGVSTNSQTQINSTSITGGFVGMQGTSMATPHAAGAIAILNQYLAMTGRTRTPGQIELILNSTGKRVQDVGFSEINFSRIDVYGAILSLDNAFPTFLNNVSYGTFRRYDNFTLNITLRDNFNLVSAWLESNHSGVFVNYTYALSGKEVNLSRSFNLTSPNNSFSYRWYFNDSAGNVNYTSLFSIRFANSPPNNSNSFNNLSWPMNSNLTLNLSVYFSDLDNDALIFNNSYLSNVSVVINQTTSIALLIPDLNFNGTRNLVFYANDSTNVSLSNNFTVNVYRPLIIINITTFNANTTNFSSLTSFVNVSIILEKSDCGRINFSSVNLNFTDINLDSYVNISSNRIEINSSALPNFNASAVLTLYNITWSYPVIYKNGVVCSSCSQISYINNTFVFNVTGFSVYNLSEASCGDGVCNGGETCSSCSGDCGSCPDTGSPSGGGGGGGGLSSTGQMYIVTEEQLAKGYSASLVVNDRFKFKIKNESHLTAVKKINSSFIELNVSSKLQEAILYSGDEKKFELTEDNYYDLSVKLNKIVDGKANITIISISELISSNNIANKTANKTLIENYGVNNAPVGSRVYGNLYRYILTVIIVVAAVIAFFIMKKFNSNIKPIKVRKIKKIENLGRKKL